MKNVCKLEELDLKILFSMLNEYSIIFIKDRGNNIVRLFEEYNPYSKKIIEDFLQKFSNSFNKKLITNKNKPLLVEVRYLIDSKWILYIYQNNARGVRLYLDFDSANLPKDIFSIIKPMENAIINKNVDFLIKKAVGNLEKGILFLEKKDIDILLKREGELLSLEKQTVIFTYRYYKSLYDKDTGRIDDNEQQKTAIELNKKVKPILDDLIDLISIKDIKLE